jgi:hypothetical protein
MGWGSEEGAGKEVVGSVSRYFFQAIEGQASLELTVFLSSPSYYGDTDWDEVFVDMRYSLPSGFVTPAPYDLTGKTLTCWIYAPVGSMGAFDHPNRFQLYVKDVNFKREAGVWVDITPNQEGTWFPITLALSVQSPPGGDMDVGFDPTHIIMLGIKISVSAEPTSGNHYGGVILIDACDW